MTYVGQRFTDSGPKPHLEIVRAVQEMNCPENLKD